MGLFDYLRGKPATPRAPTTSASAPLVGGPPPDKPGQEPPPGPKPEAAKGSPRLPAGQGGNLLQRLGQGMLGPLDNYVDEKADEILQDATQRAEQFRHETLTQVKTQALELLDVAEKRIDDKLAAIERMLEERMRAELKMKLRALVWTLVFVLLMAAVSIAYIWIKRQQGLETRTGLSAVSTGTSARQ